MSLNTDTAQREPLAIALATGAADEEQRAGAERWLRGLRER